MSNQYTMKIYPAGRGRDVYRNIEICGNSTLNQLCQIILESFNFIDEHLYEFCMDNRMYSEYAYQSDPEGDEPSAILHWMKSGWKRWRISTGRGRFFKNFFELLWKKRNIRIV